MLRKRRDVDVVNSKALDSEGFQRVLNRESTMRETYNVDIAEMVNAGAGLHEEPEGEAWASDDATGGDLDPRAVREPSLTHIRRCRRIERCSLRWSPYHYK